jgi:hypothetical protein
MLSFYALCFLLAAGPLWTAASLLRNYKAARSTKLPIVISPVNPFNPLWILSRQYINPVFAALPFGLGSFTSYNFLGFAWVSLT